MSCLVLLFSCSALMAYWTCQFAFSWVCETPSLLWKVLSLWTVSTASVWTSTKFARISFPVKRNIPTRGGIPGAERGSGHRKQMLLLEGCQHVQETQLESPDGAHEQREWNVCFLDVNFKWGGSYKKLMSRTKPQSQGQRPDTRAYAALLILGNIFMLSYIPFSSKTFTALLQYCTEVK